MPLVRGLCLLAAILAAYVLFSGHRTHGKLDYGIWYWHSPFRIEDSERETLRSVGIGTIYVRAGTFTTDGTHLKLMLPQKWESQAGGLRLVQVFNFDPGLLGHFRQFSARSMADDMVPRILKSIEEAAGHQAAPSGVQLDIDCPTSQLPKYADLLGRVKAGIAAGFKRKWTFSITALPTWLTSSSFGEVARQVDFVAPQFYENSFGRSIDHIEPVSDPAQLEAGLRRLDGRGIRFYAGLPAYGHAVLYDEKGRFVAMYPSLSAEDALRHPSLQFLSTKTTTTGEELLTLRAVRPAPDGRGMGYTLAYLLPSIDMVGKNLAIVERDAGSDCRGVIFYRFPEPGESTALPLASLVAAMRAVPQKIDFDLSVSSRSVPFESIGDSGQPMSHEISVTVQATGNAPTEASPQAFEVQLAFDRPGIGDVAPGDFDSVELGVLEGASFVPCGRARANVLRLRRCSALPGQRLKSGGIELVGEGPTRVQSSWTAHGMGSGRIASGALKQTELQR